MIIPLRFCCKFRAKVVVGAGKLLAHFERAYRPSSLVSYADVRAVGAVSLLENFDPGKSEVENMKANGYRRIFDCGNIVFEKAIDYVSK